MTTEEIDRLEAGRDADTLLVELISLPGVQLEEVPWEPGKRRPYWRHVDGGFREKFQPTTDPAAAALILNWLSDQARRMELEGERLMTPSDQQQGQSPELEICKAALRVVKRGLQRPRNPDGDRVGVFMI